MFDDIVLCHQLRKTIKKPTTCFGDKLLTDSAQNMYFKRNDGGFSPKRVQDYFFILNYLHGYNILQTSEIQLFKYNIIGIIY